MLAIEHQVDRRTKAAESVQMSKTVSFNADPTAFYFKFAVPFDDEKPLTRKTMKKVFIDKKASTLDVADISGQRLTQFPTSIYSKPSLVRYLYLQDNQLTSLPEDMFSKLDNLEWLDIRNNMIARLPRLKGHKR